MRGIGLRLDTVTQSVVGNADEPDGDTQAQRLSGSADAVRRFGLDRGILEVPDDFDAPLPDDVIDAFERAPLP